MPALVKSSVAAAPARPLPTTTTDSRAMDLLLGKSAQNTILVPCDGFNWRQLVQACVNPRNDGRRP